MKNGVAGHLLLLAALLLLAPFSASAQDAAPTKQPRLVIADPVFDFGTVPQGSKVEHKFQIANKGEANLEITKVHPSCGCTAAMPDSSVLAPGDTTYVRTTFDTAGFQGEKTKTVRLYTNDPQQATAVLTLKGTVQAEMRVEPAAVQFGNVIQGSAYQKDVNIIIEKGANVKLLEIESRSPDLTATWQDLPGGAGKKVTITLLERASVGPLRARVVAKTSSDKMPVVNIPVLAFIEGDLQINPSTVSFGYIAGPLEKEHARTVVITNRAEAPINVLSIASDNENIAAELSTLEEGRRYALKVTLKEKASGAVRARLTIKTDHEKQEERELQLPVFAIVSRDSD